MKLAIFAILALVAGPAVAAMPHLNVREVVWDVVVLIGIAVIFGLLAYAIDKAPFIGEPFKAFGKYALILIAVLIIIYIILGLLGL